MKSIRLTKHALEQCVERGTDKTEISEAIRVGFIEPAKHDRLLYRANFQYNKYWQGNIPN